MARMRTKRLKGRPLRRYALFIALALLFGVLLLQTSPRLRAMVDPARTVAADQMASSARPGLWDRITGRTAREERIRELEAEVRELTRYRSVAISMAARLEAYEEMLNVMGEPPVRGVTARITSETNGPFSEAILVNAGTLQGVEEGAYAENEGGLVGRVVQLGERSSRVLLVTDFNSRVPVMGEASGMRAIVFGDRDGYGTLTDLPERGSFITGERVLTSGEGGVFPRGVVVGEIVQRSDQARVDFGMTEASGGFVRLMPAMKIPKPEDFPAEDQAETSDETETAASETGETSPQGSGGL
ncbi:rod shape-determining protein MreC [Henriciella aquimarina]|uniref:rod shape-determining protein MreC n=1 Tax=Henriciella aquimarina TaxID=545261 RepID=UPI000A0592FB|nr:rod shape-determining protein MreC [Henriciella aquimarina]